MKQLFLKDVFQSLFKLKSQEECMYLILKIVLNDYHNISQFFDTPLVCDVCTKSVCCIF